VQEVKIHGQSVARHGTYSLEDDSLTFFDEFGNKDGPYTVAIDTEKKSMSLRMSQVHMDLLLEREFRKNRKEKAGSAAVTY
jgi:hypothetical protein